MPTIPTYNREVSLKPAYTQMNDVSASPEAFGAAIGRGLGDVGEGISQVVKAKMTLEQKLQENDGRAAVLRYQAGKNSTLLDPDEGILSRTGINARGAAKAWADKSAELRAQASEGLSGIGLEYFNRIVDEDVVQTSGTVLSHEASEVKKGVDQSFVSLIDSYSENAVTYMNDPVASSAAIDDGIKMIRERATTQGWDKATSDNLVAQFMSDTHKNIALTLGATDPLAAQAYVDAHKEEMTAEGSNYATVTATLKEAVTLKQADNAAAGYFTGGKPAASTAAEGGVDIPQEGAAFLNAMSSTEASAYNIMYGGETFSSYADHPRVAHVITEGPNKGQTSTAAGKYQFLATTWDRAAKALGLKDFSPKNQDRAAWWLAEQDYAANTGRDLMEDLKGGKYATIRAGLGSTWEGLTKKTDEEWAAMMSSASGTLPSGSMDPTEIEGYIATLPADVQDLTRSKIYGHYDNISKAQTAARTAAKQEIWDTILQTGAMPTSTELLSAAGMDNVKAAQEYLDKGGVPTQTNETIFRRLNELKAGQRENFVKVDLNDYRQQLNAADFKAMQDDQRSMLEGGKAQLDFSAAHTLSKQVVEAQIGPAPTGSDSTPARQAYDARLNALNREVEADMRAYQQANKVAPLYDDILKMVTARTLPTVKVDEGYIWDDTSKGMQFEMNSPAGQGFKLDAEAIVTTIPLDVYSAIIADLKSQGIEQTPDEIASAYQDYLLWDTVDDTDGTQTNVQKFGGGR